MLSQPTSGGEAEVTHITSTAAAEAQTAALLHRATPGKRTGVARKIRNARQVAGEIFEQFQVGPWNWKAKHLDWYFSHATAELSNHRRYELWKAARAVLMATGRPDLVELLSRRKNATYIRPTGESGKLKPQGRRALLARRKRRTEKGVTK